MAGIKAPILDILQKLNTLYIRNGDGQSVLPHVRIWNNQIQYLLEGQLSVFPMPAFFVEVVNNPTYQILGQQNRSADLSFRVHIAHEFYDAQDGTFEQDLIVFDLRDQVIANLTAFKLTGCGPLEAMSEAQDYEHKNVYHYVIDFICNFTDDIGSRYNANNPNAYIYTTPVTGLEIDTTVTVSATDSPQDFIIN